MLLISALALLVSLQDAPPQPTPAQVAQQDQQTTSLPEVAVTGDQPAPRQICRREQVTGSNRYTRVCRTEQQQELQRDSAQRRLDRMRDNNATPESETNPNAA